MKREKDQLARAEPVQLSSGGKKVTAGRRAIFKFPFHLTVIIKLSRGFLEE